MSEKRQKAIFWTVLISETGHVFCCVLPSLFSIAAILAGTGLISSVPISWLHFHDVMHKYEVPMIAISAVLLVLGWLLHMHSQKIYCHTTGCTHEPCDSNKKKTSTILKVATILFALNLAIYLSTHVYSEFAAQLSSPAGHDHSVHSHDHLH